MIYWFPNIPQLSKEQKEAQSENADYASEIFRLLIGQLDRTPIEEVLPEYA